MNKYGPRPSVMTRFFRAIVFGGFEPMEVILAISAMLHGLWLLFPYWTAEGMKQSITGSPRGMEVGIGSAICLLGLLHIITIASGRWEGARRHIAFVKFIMWGFLAWLSAIASGVTSILWVPYVTIMLISGVVYLNISIGVQDE